MINFKAHYVQQIQIKKLDNNVYKPQNVNFIEIDTSSLSDIEAINQVSPNWEDHSFADNIAYNLTQIKKGRFNKDLFRFFALTKQNDNYEKLNSDDILALAEIEKKSETNIFINYLQVDPKIVYCLEKPPIKRCGSAMLDCLKIMFNNKNIFLNSRSKNFYLKNNFVEIFKNVFVWNKFLK